MDKSFVQISMPPPDTEVGEYALVITRGQTMFGPGQTVVFFVDKLTTGNDPTGRAISVQAWRKHQMVVEFPVGTAFFMLPRERTQFYTPVEAAQQHRDEQEELEKVFHTNSAAAKTVEETVLPGEKKAFLERSYL